MTHTFARGLSGSAGQSGSQARLETAGEGSMKRKSRTACTFPTSAAKRRPSPRWSFLIVVALAGVLATSPGQAQTPITLPAGNLGVDGSGNAPAIGQVQVIFAANPSRIGLYVQSQCQPKWLMGQIPNGIVQVILDHDTGPPTIVLVGLQDAPIDWSMAAAGIRHTGRIRIAADPACQFAAGEW